MKIVLVLVPSPDCWHERPLGTSTKTGFKGLRVKSTYWQMMYRCYFSRYGGSGENQRLISTTSCIDCCKRSV